MKDQNKIHSILKIIFISLTLMLITGGVGHGSVLRGSKNQPNFLLTLADDVTYNDLGCFGGNNASKPATGTSLTVQEAQMAINNVPEFKGNVRAFRTDLLVDKAAEKLFPTWKENFEQGKLMGSDRPYHYYGSAIWYTRIGHVAGEAMLELIEN